MGLAFGIFWAAVIIGSILLLIAGSFWILEILNEVMNHENVSSTVKLLLVLPFVFMFLWCIVLEILSLIITFGLAVSLAKDIRNWWHKS